MVRSPILDLMSSLSRLLAIVASAALLALVPASAHAHAGLVDVDPADGSVVEELPREITLTFSEQVSNVEVAVTAPDGTLLDVAPRTRGSDVVVEVEPSAQAGVHTVAFRVVSGDGHPIAGESTVEVAPSSEGTSAEDTATPEASPAAATVDQESFVHRHAEHIAWIGGAGLVAIALILWPLVRRRDA